MSLFYGELAEWWPLISPVDDYAEESAELMRVMVERRPAAHTLLELGSGGGHVAFYLRQRYDYTLSDISEAMLSCSRRLNPECTHVVGDMRTLRLGEIFDIVLVHDAIDYMTTEADLAAAFETAWVHLAPGGLAVFVPDAVAETFEPGTDVSGGGEDPDGRAARLFEWVEDRDPLTGEVVVHYVFLLRDRDGTVAHHYEQHNTAVFPQATWERLLAEQRWDAEVVIERTDEDRTPRRIFLGSKVR